MSWKPTIRRSLHIGPKVKLPAGHPLPEPAEDMAIKIEKLGTKEKNNVADERNPYRMSDVAASLPDIKERSKNDDFYFDNYISDIEIDQESDDCHSLFDDSEGSTLGQSTSSFMSWMDEAELEKSKEVQRLVDEIDDAIYDSVPFPVTDQKALEILEQIRSSQLHLRVIGGQLEEFPPIATVLDEDPVDDQDVIEVFASHGIYNECNDQVIQRNITLQPPQGGNVDVLEVQPDINLRYCDESSSFHCENKYRDGGKNCFEERTNVADRLLEKVKGCVMDQLVHYVFSEAVKSWDFVCNLNLSSLSDDDSSNEQLSSPRPNTREEDGDNSFRPHFVQQLPLHLEPSTSQKNKLYDDFLHVSPMAIHHIPKRSVNRSKYSPSRNNFEFPSCLNQFPPQRNSCKKEFEKLDFSEVPPISIVPLLKTNSVLPLCNEVEKGVKLRGYHSAAAGKKPELLNRRFSITAGHERFLEPLMETEFSNRQRQQASAPATPAKWLRRYTLPPINVNEVANHSKISATDSSLLATKLLENSKSKVTLIPLNMPVLGTGLTRLKFAKQLLQQTDNTMLWNTNGSIDFQTANNYRTRKDERKSGAGKR